MAARDRFGGLGEPAGTPLQNCIRNAVNPQNFEPNLALNLEVADMINAKKGNAPREAAIAIVNFANHRNANVALLALNLLDICVKNCGYPFHLQISTKEFLNELVRRFPERPPVHPSRVQNRVLELIEEWRSTICQTSKYKEDLGFIRDMHRLLSYKGYVFPEVRREDAAVLNPSEALRSAEEMEEEERAAQSAKLQELIRRGGPHDLQEANKLMKVMAGYDTRNKTDWRAKAAEEVARVQQKAKLLEDMLQRQTPGQPLEGGDVYEELANALMSAHPKIQRMCEEESEDHEAVAKLFEINDSIHRTIERYKLIKSGDVEGASKIPRGTLGTSGAGVSQGPNNELSLIDFGDPEEEPSVPVIQSQSDTSVPPPPKGNALEDDLLGLSMDDNYPQNGAIALGSSNGFGTASSNPAPQLSNAQITSMFQQPPVQNTPTPSASLFSSTSVQHTATASSPQSAKNPFAALSPSNQTSRQASPFQYQQSIQPPQPQQASSISAPSASQDDEWDFTSALPPSTPASLSLINSSISISWDLSRPSDQSSVIEIKSRVSNNSALPISKLTFQVAVRKSYSLQLDPQSATSLNPHQKDGITQIIHLNGVERGQGSGVRMRWKVGYTLGQEAKEEGGGIDGLPGSL